MTRKVLASGILCILMGIAVSGALATIVDNDPSNDVMTGAFLLEYSGATPWSDIGDCNFSSSSDVDYFEIDLNVNNVITVTTTPLNDNNLSDPDSYIELLDANENSLISSENPGGNVVRYKVTSGGTYYIKTYTSDADSGDYSLLVGVTHLPEPATIFLLILGGLSAFGTSRRKSS